MTPLVLRVPDFSKTIDRKPNDNCKPYRMPLAYDHDAIERGLHNLSDYKKPHGFHSIERSYPRDDSMYRFDKEVVKAMRRKNMKKEFSYSNYLPNTIRSQMHSRNSLATTA